MLSRREDFFDQTPGALVAEEVFEVDAQPLPLTFERYHGARPAVAVGDGTRDVGGPYGGTVFTDGGRGAGAIQVQQGGARAQASGQKFGLAFGH